MVRSTIASRKALLCWEYGHGLGHISALRIVARKLKLLGWHVCLIHPSNINVAADSCFDEVESLPHIGQLTANQKNALSGASFDNVIYHMGLGSPKFLFTRLKLWQVALDRIKPDVVIADFAPCALIAARDTLPSIAMGNGYTLPAVGMTHYPRYQNVKRNVDGAALLVGINRGLELAGFSQIEHVPEVFRADVQACATFGFLDPFRAVRSEPLIKPIYKNKVTTRSKTEGSEVFAYFTDCTPQVLSLTLQGLIKSKESCFGYALDAKDEHFALVEGTNVELAKQPFKLSEVLDRSKLVVHTGGHGLMTEMLAAGVPQTVLTIDIEKRLHAQALIEKGFGTWVAVTNLPPVDEVASGISEAANDSEMPRRVLEFAQSLPTNILDVAIDKICDCANELAR